MKKIDLFLILGFIVLMTIIIIGFFMLKQEGSLCLKNPVVYGIKEINKQNNISFECSCILGQNYYTLSEKGFSQKNNSLNLGQNQISLILVDEND